MRPPPAVRWRIENQDLLWQGLNSVLWLFTAVALILWLLEHAVDRWPALVVAGRPRFFVMVLLGGALLIALGIAWAGWRVGRQPAGWLMWTGGCWRWHADGATAQEVAAQVMLDMGGWMLLRVTPAAGTPWRSPRVWLSVRAPARLAPEQVQWTAFRAAVYSAASGPGGAFESNNPSF